MPKETIHIPIPVMETFDPEGLAVPQWVLAKAIMDLANLALMQHGIVLEVAQHNDPDKSVHDLVQPGPERLTDSDLINLAIERSRQTGRPITNAAARVIASQLHGGQASAMYSLASSGFIDMERLRDEYKRDYNDPQTTDEVKAWIDSLDAYVSSRESHEAVEGWSHLWPHEGEPLEDQDNHCPACGAHLAEPHAPACALNPDNEE